MRSAIETTPRIHPDAFELAEILRPFWAGMSADLRAAGVPLCEGDDDDEKVEVSKKELDAAKRGAAEAAKAKKRADAAEEKLDGLESKVEDLEQKLEASDDSSEIEKLTKRVERAEAAREKAEAEKADAEAKAAKAEVERTGVSVAQRLGFRKPSQAIRLLDSDDLESEADFERELERLAKEEPYLVAQKRQRQVEDPKGRKNGSDPDDDDDPDKREREGDDEATGPERLRNYYREQEKAAAAKGSEGDD